MLGFCTPKGENEGILHFIRDCSSCQGGSLKQSVRGRCEQAPCAWLLGLDCRSNGPGLSLVFPCASASAGFPCKRKGD